VEAVRQWVVNRLNGRVANDVFVRIEDALHATNFVPVSRAGIAIPFSAILAAPRIPTRSGSMRISSASLDRSEGEPLSGRPTTVHKQRCAGNQ
jgi:hypothetical protein